MVKYLLVVWVPRVSIDLVERDQQRVPTLAHLDVEKASSRALASC